MAPKPKEKTIRVGLLVAASLIVLMIFVFFIGSEQKIFSRKNEYKVRLDNVTGLAEGNPVKISGVTVGVIKDITLPRDPKMRDVDIELMVDRKYADRIRTDSRARLKKLGLLAGDSYIDISPGSPKFDALEPGAMIPAARQTNVDQLISSGEDLVDNFVQISYSLKNILGRVDRGEGLIGELTTHAGDEAAHHRHVPDDAEQDQRHPRPRRERQGPGRQARLRRQVRRRSSPARSRRARARCRRSSPTCRGV